MVQPEATLLFRNKLFYELLMRSQTQHGVRTDRHVAVFSYISLVIIACSALFSCASLPPTTEAPAFTRKFSGFEYCLVDVTRQSSQYSCGPACLVTILKYWEKDVSEDYLVDTYPNSEEGGYKLTELKEMAESEGLNAFALAMLSDSKEALKEHILSGRPLVCAMRLPRYLFLLDRIPLVKHNYRAMTWSVGTRKNHFVVVFGLSKKRVLIMDPASGFRVVSWKRFEQAWSKMNYATLLVSS